MRVLAIISAALATSCSSNVAVRDCEVSCATAGCLDGFTCGDESLCRAAGASGTCAAVLDGGANGILPIAIAIAR